MSISTNTGSPHSHSLSLPPEVPALLPPPPSSDSSSSLVSRTHTPHPPVRPRPSKTPLRPALSPYPTPTASSPPTCGRRLNSSEVPWRSLPIPCGSTRNSKGSVGFFKVVCGGLENRGARSHDSLRSLHGWPARDILTTTPESHNGHGLNDKIFSFFQPVSKYRNPFFCVLFFVCSCETICPYVFAVLLGYILSCTRIPR